jgi:hypothetical protein
MKSEFLETLTSMEGKVCWSCLGGTPSGSMVNLHIGNKIKRERALSNPNLTDDERIYWGEYGLLVRSSTWRIRTREKVVCGSSESSEEGGPMVRGLAQLKGKVISLVAIEDVTLDLTISFDDALIFDLFCSQTNQEAPYDNYSIRFRDRYFVVGCRSLLREE